MHVRPEALALVAGAYLYIIYIYKLVGSIGTIYWEAEAANGRRWQRRAPIVASRWEPAAACFVRLVGRRHRRRSCSAFLRLPVLDSAAPARPERAWLPFSSRGRKGPPC